MVSACVIAHNEERNLRRCLESLDWADEIVVVDAFSEDRTREIAREFTDRVFRNPWPGHVEQKNFALDRASHDWIFAIDADEEVSPELRESVLRALMGGDGRYQGYFVTRRVCYLGRWIGHCGWYPEYRLRLFRKSAGRWTGTNPHDRVEVSGSTSRLSGDLYHRPYEDLDAHFETIGRYSAIWAREMSARGRRFHWMDLATRPAFRFFRMFVLRLGFLDGMAGLVASGMGAVYVFAKYGKLWELERARPPDRQESGERASR